MTTFADFGLDPAILKALERMEYKEPSSVQAATIPIIQQKRDLIALARTGSGKTAACAIPVCNRVNVTLPHVQALIVVPTRELASQYATEAQKIGRDRNVSVFSILGGEDASMQQAKLRHGVQVLIATPGRLIDFIHSRQIDLSHVETLILDEADEMLSMGFCEDLEFIMQCLVQEHQTLLFSATMPTAIRKIAKNYMKDPMEISLLSEQTAPSITEHKFLYCRHDQRDNALKELILELKPKQGIIFCQSRHQCEAVSRALHKDVQAVEYLHAGLNQDLRSIITGKFRSGKIRFLVATDVAARGLDFSGVTHVFIYHLSDDPDIYVHRSGRTGRYNREGMVVTLVTDREMHVISRVAKQIQREPIWIGNPPPPARPHDRAHHVRPAGRHPKRSSGPGK